MDRAYLQWNIVNWVTVVLMAAVGIMFIGLLGSALKTYKLPQVNPETQG